MKNILVLGGGTSGLITALLLKTRFNLINIKVIKSDKIGIVGVGEAAENAWYSFCNFVGIDFKELIKETDATIKYGIKFEDWTKKDFYHIVSNTLSSSTKLGQYLAGYAYAITNNIHTNSLTYSTIQKNFNNNQSKGYMFNTFKLNTFLLKKCKDINIEIIEDEIKDVVVDKNGIKYILGSKKYTSDFYIDASGYRKTLISKLKSKWISYSKYMRLKEAIVFPTEDTEEYNTYVLSKALDYGWNFRIPTYGRWGNGYIFDSNYISKEQAHEEVEKVYKKRINIERHIKFDPGRLDAAWIKNCLAVGLSASFFEPLEATAIGITVNQVFMSMHYLINYDQKNIDSYNTTFKEMIENARDFVLIHYLNKKNTSKFWIDNQHIQLPESLQYKLQEWEHRLPIEDDLVRTKFKLFWEYNFTHILYNLNYFNKHSIKKQFEALSSYYKEYVKNKKITKNKIIKY
jgi:tryptophan halogenase